MESNRQPVKREGSLTLKNTKPSSECVVLISPRAVVLAVVIVDIKQARQIGRLDIQYWSSSFLVQGQRRKWHPLQAGTSCYSWMRQMGK
jgi:hypothetical protein